MTKLNKTRGLLSCIMICNILLAIFFFEFGYNNPDSLVKVNENTIPLYCFVGAKALHNEPKFIISPLFEIDGYTTVTKSFIKWF